MWFPHGNHVMSKFETMWCPQRNHMVPTWKSCGDHMDITCIPCGHQDMICYVTWVAIRIRKITNLWMPVTSLIIVWFSIHEKFWKALSLFYQMVISYVVPHRFPLFPQAGMMWSFPFHSSDLNRIAHGNNVVAARGYDRERHGPFDWPSNREDQELSKLLRIENRTIIKEVTGIQRLVIFQLLIATEVT